MTATTASKQTEKRETSPRAQRSGTTKPAAVIIGLGSMQGLQAARILAAHKIPVIGIAVDPKNALSKTNVCKEIIFAPTSQEELISHLVQIGSRLDEKAVLFPCEDTNVLLVSRHRHQLERYYHVLLPEANVVEMLMDKVSFYSFAQENELPIPRTFFIENKIDIKKAAQLVTYPCVLKPRDSAARKWEHETIFKAFKIYESDELIATYSHYQQWTDSFIVQEWIEGDDSDLYSCNCYFDQNSEPLVTFVARKLRQWPPETGVSCLGEEVRNDIVLDQTLRLFRSVNYRGLGYLEMKRDKRTGEFFIVEPNIGRPTGRSTIAEAGGVELLHTAYCDALGLPLPENRKQTYQGVKWIHLRKDLQSSVQYWRRGELTFFQWWRSLRGKKAYAIGSWRDPWPFIYDWFSAVRSFLSSRQREKKRNLKNLQTKRVEKKHESAKMIGLLFKFRENSFHQTWIEFALAFRAIFFIGNKHVCSCCGWKLRAFTHGGTSLKVRPYGYCPRCNSKARHRRDWLFLKEKTNLFSEQLHLLHVSPKYALSRCLVKMPNIEFVGVDLEGRPNVSVKVDITEIPFESESYNAILCIHVLEHVENDRKAIKELFRILKPGGWALISVPIDFSRQTYEDPSIVSPEEQKKHFGEEGHVRVYGFDFADRLKKVGFMVQLDRGADLPFDITEKYGLLYDENVFYCTKA